MKQKVITGSHVAPTSWEGITVGGNHRQNKELWQSKGQAQMHSTSQVSSNQSSKSTAYQLGQRPRFNPESMRGQRTSHYLLRIAFSSTKKFSPLNSVTLAQTIHATFRSSSCWLASILCKLRFSKHLYDLLLPSSIN